MQKRLFIYQFLGDQIFGIIQEGFTLIIVSVFITKTFLLKIFCTSLNCVAYARLVNYHWFSPAEVLIIGCDRHPEVPVTVEI